MDRARIPLSSTSLPDGTKKLLIANSMPALDDVAEKSAAELMLIKGFGQKALLAVRKSLNYYGMRLLNDPPPGTPEFDALGIEENEPNYPWEH